MRSVAASCVASIVALAACTNAYDDLVLLSDPGAGGADTTAAGSAGDVAAPGVGGGNVGGKNTAGAPSGSANASSSASSSASSTASSSAGGGGGAPPLECWGPDAVCCGNAACPTATMECCAASQSQAENAACVPSGSCQGLTIECDDWEDCQGEVCCTEWDNSINQHLHIECKPSCVPPSPLGISGIYPICNTQGGSCPYGLTCYVDAYIGDAGWGYCY